MKKYKLLVWIMIMVVGLDGQSTDPMTDVADDLIGILKEALKNNFVPIFSGMIIIGGIIIKRFCIDEAVRRIFTKKYRRYFSLDFMVLYLGIILGISLIWFDAFFVGSSVDTTSISAKLISLITTFGITVLTYQYILNHFFSFLEKNGLNVNSRGK